MHIICSILVGDFHNIWAIFVYPSYIFHPLIQFDGIINSIFQVAKRIFDPFYENLDFGDWALQNGADDPELAAIIEDYFPWWSLQKMKTIK